MLPEQNETVETQTPETAVTTEDTTTSASKKKPFILIIVGVVLLALGYLAFFTDFFATPPATVNGVSISQVELDNSITNVTDELAAQGVDISTDQAKGIIESDALNRLINTELLLQAAAAAGYSVEEGAVNDQVELLTNQFGGKEKLNEHLAELKLTEEMMREDISEQLSVEAYLTGETKIAEITASEEDVINFYNNLRDQYGDQLPPLPDIRLQVEGDVLGQKQQELLGQILADLRAEASVIIN